MRQRIVRYLILKVKLIFIVMLYYDVLDDIADGSGIPNEVHPYLHVIPKYAWVEVMVDMIERQIIDETRDDLYEYAKFWEYMLYQKFSQLN